jgi:hypothetical protein
MLFFSIEGASQKQEHVGSGFASMLLFQNRSG